MCKYAWNQLTGKTAMDNSKADAAAAKAEMDAKEAKRQADIKTGQGSIDHAFAQYGDDYFKHFRDSYVGTKNPEIDRQYGVAKDKMVAGLAGRGVLDSTIGANALGQLEERRGSAQGDVANEASDLSNDFRGQVEKSKTDLYALNTAAGDPNMIASRAAGESTALIPPQSSSPLGNLFGDVLSPYAAYQKSNAYAPGAYGGFSYGGSAPTSGGGSGRVVG